MGLIDTVAAQLAEEVKGIDAFRRTAAKHLILMQQAVSGELPSNAENRKEVKEAVNTVTDFYRRSLGIGDRNFPDSFWEDAKTKEIAGLISHTWKWLMGKDLIRFADAAAILRAIDPDEYSKDSHSSDRIYMNSLTTPSRGNPALTLYWDIDDKYPRRLSKREVIAFLAEKNRE